LGYVFIFVGVYGKKSIGGRINYSPVVQSYRVRLAFAVRCRSESVNGFIVKVYKISHFQPFLDCPQNVKPLAPHFEATNVCKLREIIPATLNRFASMLQGFKVLRLQLGD